MSVVIIGDNTDEFIEGEDNCDDTISALGGDDEVFGKSGDDLISGYGGDDIIDGGEGEDFLRGGRGDDSVSGGLGDDRIEGRRGDDVLEGGEGSDLLRGGKGNDLLDGGEGVDVLHGGKGEDTFVVDVVTEGGMFSLEDRINQFNGGGEIDTLVLRLESGDTLEAVFDTEIPAGSNIADGTKITIGDDGLVSFVDDAADDMPSF